MGPIQANMTPEESAPIIRKSFDMGINFYDTAKGYQTYRHLALGLQGIPRDRVVIASKSHSRSYDEMKADVEECLQELSLENVGIFQLHQVSSLDDLNGRREALNCLIDLKKSGLVGAIGASTHTIAGVQALNREPKIDVLFPVLNKRGLGIIDGRLEQMLKVLGQSKDKGKFIYAMKPLGGGHLHEEVEDSLRFLCELPTCDAVAIGMKDEAEIEMNLAIFNDQPITEDLAQRIHNVSRRLVVYDRCIGCSLCIDECDQGALSLVNGKAIVDEHKCILCGYCAAVCPEYVLRIV
jgi:aryl-alcohol dehydrogenase-like predicted oxidoreductase